MPRSGFVVPKAIEDLGEVPAGRVRELVRDAERRMNREGAEALEASLRIVPRPLRPLVRKVISG